VAESRQFGRNPPKGQPTPIELLRQHHDLGALLLMRLAAFGPAARCALAVAGSLQLGNQRGFFELGDCTEHLPDQHRGRGVCQKEVRRTCRHQFNTQLAQVVVAGKVISSISQGLCILVGCHVQDTEKDSDYIANKVLNLRLWPSLADPSKAWSSSVKDNKFQVMLVSQFTLYAVLKGNKPDFHNSMSTNPAKMFYENFVNKVRKLHGADNVADGQFGEMMEVRLSNDGPVTIELDSDSQPWRSQLAAVDASPLASKYCSSLECCAQANGNGFCAACHPKTK